MNDISISTVHDRFFYNYGYYWVKDTVNRADVTILGNRSKRKISHLDPYYVVLPHRTDYGIHYGSTRSRRILCVARRTVIS